MAKTIVPTGSTPLPRPSGRPGGVSGCLRVRPATADGSGEEDENGDVSTSRIGGGGEEDEADKAGASGCWAWRARFARQTDSSSARMARVQVSSSVAFSTIPEAGWLYCLQLNPAVATMGRRFS